MRFTGSPGSLSRPIGRVRLAAQREFTDRGFQTAAWWQTIVCSPQTVTLWSNGYYVSWGFEGTVTDGYFGSGSKGIGNERKFVCTSYAYAFGESYFGGSLPADMEFELAPEYGVGCAPYDHDPSKIGHFLTMPDAGHPLEIQRIGRRRDPDNYWNELVSYRWTWRGEDRGTFEVSKQDGFNGDTHPVAMRTAVDLLTANCAR